MIYKCLYNRGLSVLLALNRNAKNSVPSKDNSHLEIEGIIAV